MVMISFSNMTPHQLTRQNWLKPGCQLTVETSSMYGTDSVNKKRVYDTFFSDIK